MAETVFSSDLENAFFGHIGAKSLVVLGRDSSH